LAELNRNVEGALAILERLAEYPELSDEDFVVRQAYLREQVANVNMTVLNALGESEQKLMLSANRERVAFEKKIRDPDDCYLEVMSREDERREQGLPPMIGILHGRNGTAREEILRISIEGAESEEGGTSEESSS
jgi:predicted alpha/beta-fold hydrolase